MTIEKTIETLRTLRSNLCAAIRRAEMLWLGMASDYQSSYASSSNYDKSFKHGYYDRATACHEIAAQVDALELPTTEREIAPFVASVKSAAEGYPQHPDVRESVERLIAEMDSIASTAGATGEENS